jgi:1,2-diacylglycerol 3-beta-glucosyltransferase
MYNKDENILTNLQHIEFSIYGDVLLKARDMLGGAAFLGGNGQITRKDVLHEYHGWDGYALTEDLNISVKLMINGWKIRYCGEPWLIRKQLKIGSHFLDKELDGPWATWKRYLFISNQLYYQIYHYSKR